MTASRHGSTDQPEPRDVPSWQPELDEVRRRRQIAEQLGGPANVERQHNYGRLTARERIDVLLDKNSFREIGALTGAATYDDAGGLENVVPANIIIGEGTISGTKIAVSADDFTVRGGSSEATSPEKWQFAERLALEQRWPLVRLVDAAGGSIRILEKNQSTKIPGYPHWPAAEMLGVIPVVGVALGPCAGLGAVRVVTSHFSVMPKKTSQVFAAGPRVVAPGIGEEMTNEELGGSQVHARGSGVVDNEAEDEEDALRQVRRFLSYLPSSVFAVPPRHETGDPPDRAEARLLSLVPRDRRRVYKAREILELVFDKESLFEIGRHQGGSTITMLGRLNGYSVGVMANDPYVSGGAMTAAAAEKITRFVDMCDTFHVPIVNFVDQPGVHVGSKAEQKGTIRKAIRARLSLSQVSIPWCAVFVRRAFGVAGAAYGPLHDTYVRYAWPSAYWGSIPVEGGVEAAYRRDIDSSEDPAARRDELVDHFRQFESPLRTAERFGIEDVIDPRQTRPLLCEWIEEAYEKVPELLGITARTMRV
ncbi:MAG: propionyl-CoA carboxylase [Propionibacteriales bacterium]|nr:propionyl-CoA carboxylase [Propionibacteriales bacterium]MQA06519.1 propionyl-CoA carboxylase [Streptosporangiales bacterium]